MASPHVRDAIERASERSIPASFVGHVSISGSTLTTTNLRGHIGKYQLTGYGTGAVAGKQFEGGDVYLGNSQGNIQLGLSPTYQVRAGRSLTRTFAISVVDATGAYAPFATSTGTITRWNVPAKPNATARFSALFTV